MNGMLDGDYLAEIQSLKEAHAREISQVRESYADLIRQKQWKINNLVDQVNLLTSRRRIGA